jgi:hypothetical protein
MWTTSCLPRGTMVGPTCQVTCAWVGPTCWHGPMGGCHVAYWIEVASLCATIWHLPCCCGPFIGCQVAAVLMWPVMWTNQGLPCVSGKSDWVKEYYATWHGLGEVDQWGADTWHKWDPHGWGGPMRCWHVALTCWGGPMRCWHATPSFSLLWFCMCMFEIPNLHPAVYLSPSCTQISPWLNLSHWLIHLICFMSSEFISIAPLIQKSWNFHQKSLNSWWSLIYFLILFFPSSPYIKNLFVKKTLFLPLN